MPTTPQATQEITQPVPAFTPGPWQIDLDPDEEKTLVAEAGSWFITAPGTYEIEGEEDDANARLIAAAPELFTACQEALDELEAYRDSILEGHSLLDEHGKPDLTTLDETAKADLNAHLLPLIERIQKALQKVEKH